MKVVIYTVVTGGYDEIKTIRNPIDSIDYIVVSDENIKVPFGWKLKIVNREPSLSLTDLNRLYKIKPKILFDDYDCSIYVDGNIEIVSDDILSYLNNALKHDDIALYSHPERDSVRDESLLLSYLGFDHFLKIRNQYVNYLNEGFVDNCLFECNVLFRKHNNRIYEMMDFWYEEYIKNVKRDQLSFTYVAWNQRVNLKNLGDSDARFKNEHFCYHYHSKKNTNKKIINKIINRLFMRFYKW